MLAQSVGCNRVIVESDCLEMLNTMLDGARSQRIAAAIFDDCYYLSTEFIKIQFDHVPRDSKSVAHELATLPRGSLPAKMYGWMNHQIRLYLLWFPM